jgi:hypothetical protein
MIIPCHSPQAKLIINISTKFIYLFIRNIKKKNYCVKKLYKYNSQSNIITINS